MSTLEVINKGNYSMETRDREAAALARRSAGWEHEYTVYRDAWRLRPQNNDYGKWPLLVDMELSSACNLKCPMCYTISDDFKHKVSRQYMDVDLFRCIINEIAPHVPALRLSLRGESTLHPQFMDCLAYAKQRGVREVSFLTNGSKFNTNFISQLLYAGADWITFSIDGLKDAYESIRKPLKFENTVRNIVQLKEARDARHMQRPLIKVQGIWPAISKTQNGHDAYYQLFSQIADEVAFNPLITYDDKNIDAEFYIDDFCCPMLYQRLVITSDGNVLACANDEKSEHVITTIEGKTITDVWNGPELSAFRHTHRQKNGFMRFGHCKNCYLPRKTLDKQICFKDGRSFIVKDYLPLI